MNSTANRVPDATGPFAAPLASAPNFRSLSGIRTADGRIVREGRLFRSEVLSRLTTDDINRMRTLDIGMVCDLRSARECAAESNRWPAPEHVQTVLRKQDGGISDAMRVNWETRLLEEDFDEEQAGHYMMEAYRAMPAELAGHVAALIDYCLRPDSRGVLIHCMAGKDRTGFVCAMILSALGTPIETIVADYLESEKRFARSGRIEAALARLFGAATIPDRATRAAAAIATVKTGYLRAALNEIDREHGSIDAYLINIAGLDSDRIDRLRNQLLEPADRKQPT